MSFMVPNADGTLPEADGGMTFHCVAAYRSVLINGVEYLRIKPWLGKDFGDHGYVYLSREQFNNWLRPPMCSTRTPFDGFPSLA